MIELIVGGARSGKSRYALENAKQTNANLSFVATAQSTTAADDEEMAVRILRHQQERGPEWQLIEEPFRLSALIRRFSERDAVVVDCLTLWLSNWLCQQQLAGWKQEKEAFISGIKNSKANWFLVSNETGLGIVPIEKLGRQFVDESGWLHQELADVADQVVMVLFGLPQILKQRDWTVRNNQ